MFNKINMRNESFSFLIHVSFHDKDEYGMH